MVFKVLVEWCLSKEKRTKMRGVGLGDEQPDLNGWKASQFNGDILCPIYQSEFLVAVRDETELEHLGYQLFG